MASLMLLGLLLGMKHALEADHVAAVAALATRSASLRQTALLGVVWGAGHSLTLLAFGGAVLAMSMTVPRGMADALEFAVGLMLVVLGLDVLRRVAKRRIHAHAHRHPGGVLHLHLHSHAPDAVLHHAAEHRHLHARDFPVRALAVGMMHGMAGSAALVLLSLGAVQSPALGLLYIALFGIGSIAGMALLSVAIAIPLRLSAGRLSRLHNGMTALVGGFTCALGVFIVYHIGFVEGLLRG